MDILKDVISPLGLGVASNAIWEVTRNYLVTTQQPSEQGIIQVLSKNFGSQISIDKATIIAKRILEVRTQYGASVILGEGHYQGGSSYVLVGTGAKIQMVGDTKIIMK